MEILEAHIAGDRYAIAWMLGLSGLRRGEIAGMRWADVDLDSETLTVAHTRLRYGTNLVESTPKSRAGGRELPLPPHLVAEFKAARRIQAADRLRLGADYQPSGYVVVDESGAALSPHALTSRWARMLKAAGVRHVRLHDRPAHLRHPDAPEERADRADLSGLGHASKAFTLQTYVNPHRSALDVAAKSFATKMRDLS